MELLMQCQVDFNMYEPHKQVCWDSNNKFENWESLHIVLNFCIHYN